MIIKNITKYNKGEISRGFLIAGAIIVVIIIITFIVIRVTKKSPEEGGIKEPEEPVYEATIRDIKFTFINAEDKGNILRGSESIYPDRQKDLTTKEKFIKVIIGAQNIGKENISKEKWGLRELTDNEGRIFKPMDSMAVKAWIVAEGYKGNQCGILLKPGFSPLPCIRIYEVAKISTDFKVKVFFETEKDIPEEEKEAIIDLLIR